MDQRASEGDEVLANANLAINLEYIFAMARLLVKSQAFVCQQGFDDGRIALSPVLLLVWFHLDGVVRSRLQVLHAAQAFSYPPVL